ncbi:hypothetical protein ABIC83_002923 [Roseateles asaccharophilus]|uniref:hypothetical protein n=1 Tax=Roseateles asaccharophilus TaxID=582607 RepID=UPI003835E7EA
MSTLPLPPLTAEQEARLQATRDVLATDPDAYQRNGGLGSVLRTVDIAAFLALAARGRYYRDHLITELQKGVVPVNNAATDHEAYFFERVLDYVEASDQRQRRFAALMAGVAVMLPFARAARHTFDVLEAGSVFDQRLRRYLKAAGQAQGGPNSVAGMPAEIYWASWIGGCGVRTREQQPTDLYTRFWGGFCRFALERGVTDEMPISIGPLELPETTDGCMNFITGVHQVLGESEANQFAAAQARWRASSMSRVISDVVDNVMSTLDTKRITQRPLRAI